MSRGCGSHQPNGRTAADTRALHLLVMAPGDAQTTDMCPANRYRDDYTYHAQCEHGVALSDSRCSRFVWSAESSAACFRVASGTCLLAWQCLLDHVSCSGHIRSCLLCRGALSAALFGSSRGLGRSWSVVVKVPQHIASADYYSHRRWPGWSFIDFRPWGRGQVETIVYAGIMQGVHKQQGCDHRRCHQ